MVALDLVVLGAGPGGYVAALRARQLGLSVTVVEAERAGGVCGNWGCIPSKALLSDAALVASLRDAAARGIHTGELRVDFDRVVARSREVAAQQAKGVEFLFRKAGVTLVAGRGRLVGGGGVEVAAADGTVTRLEGRHVLLATGSVERTLPGIPIDGEVVITSREALDKRDLPGRVVVVGGGAIGVELAYVYATFGSQVTVVEMAPQLLPLMDVDLGRELARHFARHGIEVLVGTKVAGCRRDGKTAAVTVATAAGERTLAADVVLIAVGRTPQLDGLGLEAAGVRTERGRIVVDDRLQTSVPTIFAIGDLVGPLLLAHAASAQGVIAVETMAGRPPAAGLDPTRVPMAVYCEPEVAAVGLTEAEARARGGEIAVGKFAFRALGKAMATGDTAGFVKVVLDRRYGEILGVHLIGHGVTELVGEATLARALEATADDVVATVHAHPTLAEAIREATLAALGEGVNA